MDGTEGSPQSSQLDDTVSRAWAHNNKYIVQILYDSIDDLDGDLTGLIRP
jgi:hypothetical protein